MRGTLVAAARAVGVIASAEAQDRSADIRFSSTGIAVGIGFTSADGTLLNTTW